MKPFSIFLIVLFFYSCSENKFIDENLPDFDVVTPENINTKLPIVNITAQPEEFNQMFSMFHDKIRIDALFSISYDGKTLSRLPVQIELKGFGSKYFDLRSLGVTFVNPFPNSDFQLVNPEFVPHQTEYISSIRLRNSGMDFMRTMIKDMAYTQFAVENYLGIEVMYNGSASQVFINGIYYGLLNIRNENNTQALARLLGYDETLITLFSLERENGKFKLRSGNKDFGKLFTNAIKTKDASLLTELIDIPNFIDYIIYEDYIGNEDWPHGNVRAYSGPNQKIRFILHDVDLAALRTRNPRIPELEFLPYDLAKIYRILRSQDQKSFDERLRSRQKNLYADFEQQHFNEIVDSLAARIKDDIDLQISKYGFPENKIEWYKEIDILKRDFERRDHFIRSKYDL